MSKRHLREHWINFAHVLHAAPGGTCQVVLTFEFPDDAREALEMLCTGRELVGGGVRHDDELHCPVHDH